MPRSALTAIDLLNMKAADETQAFASTPSASKGSNGAKSRKAMASTISESALPDP